MTEILEDGVVRVGVEDTGVAEKLAKVSAEFRAAMKELGREGATIRIKGNIQDLKFAIADAKARLTALSAEEEALARKRDQLAGAQKGAATRRINDLQREQRSVANLLEGQNQQLTALQRYTAAVQQVSREEAARNRVESDAARQRDHRIGQERKLAQMQSDAIRMDRERDLGNIQRTQQLIRLQQQYADAKARVDRLDRASGRAVGSDKQRIQLDTAGATADMAALHERLRLIGAKPIEQKVDVDTSAAEKAWNLFTHGTLDGKETQTTIDDVGKRLKSMLSTNVNVGPFNTSIKSVILALGGLAPVIASVGGAAGSLVAVLGSGIVGAAGLGGAALSGFALAAIGVKSALAGQLQQLGAFKQALTAYQTAQLRYGPPSGSTPASQRAQARIPLEQDRVKIAQENLNRVTAQYGSSSIQAQRASLSLASAQSALANTQNSVSTASNRTQKALDKLNQVIGQSNPQIRAAERGWLSLSTTWNKLVSGNAKRDFGAALADTFKTANADVGFFARDTNQALDSLSSGWERWMARLRTPEAQHVLDNIFQNFNRTIKPVMDGLGNLAASLGRWFSTMSDYLPGIAKGFDAWSGRVNDASKATDGWQRGSVTLIESLKSIGHFAEAAGKWLFALFAPAVRPGNNFVDAMANSLDRSAKAMRTLQGQRNLTDFYQRAIEGAKQLWHALTPLASVFIHLADLFGPLASAAANALTIFGKIAAGITGFAGPLGKVLLDITGFIVAGRLLGKLAPLVGMFSALRLGVMGVSAAITGFKAGGIGQAIAEWKRVSSETSSTVSAKIERALNVGAEKIAADFEAAGNTVAERIGAAMEAAGTADAAEIGGAMEAAGTADAVTIGTVTGIGGAGAAAGATEGGAGIAGGVLSGVGAGPFAALAALALLAKTSIDSQQTPSGQFLHGFSPGFGDAAFRRQQANEFDQLQHDRATPPAGVGRSLTAAAAPRGNQAPGQVAPDPRGGGPGHLPTPQLTKAQKTKVLDDATTLGRQAGEQLGKGWEQFKFQDEPTMVKQLRGELNNPKMTDAARAGATSAAVTYAQTLERQGKLPKGSAQKMLKEIEAEFPGVVQYLGRSAKSAAAAYKNGLDLTSTRKSLLSTLNRMRGDFGVVTDAMDNTKGSVQQKSAAMVKALLDIARHGSGPARALAIKDIHAIEDTQARSFGRIVSNVTSSGIKFKNAVASNSNAAFSIGSANFNGLARAIAGAIGGGAEATAKGLQNITAQVNAAISQFGGGALSSTTVAALSPNQLAALLGGFITAESVIPQSGNGPGGLPGHAAGGRVPGPNGGMDTWTLVDGAGTPRGRVGGGELLIANRHTEQAASLATQMVFGKSLGEMVTGEHKPHNHYATGGTVVTGRVSTFGPPTEAAGSTAGGHSSADPGISLRIAGTSYGDSRNRALMNHMFRVTINGHAANLPDIDLGPNESTNRDIDVTGAGARIMGFDPASFPTDSIGTAVETSGTIGPVSGGVTIMAPKVKGHGLMPTMANAEFKKVTDQANKYVQKLQAKFLATQAGSGMLQTGKPIGHGAFAALSLGRTDQGVDFGGSGPVGAVLDGRVKSTGLWPGWPGTGGIVYSTARGNVYVMEDFAPTVAANTNVKQNQTIGIATGGSSGIEAGWADAAGSGPLIRYNGAPDGTPMPGGINFRQFLGYKLGGRIGSNLAGFQMGGRLGPHAAVDHKRRTKAPGAHRTAGKSIGLSPAQQDVVKNEKIFAQIQRAKDAYDNYNNEIHHGHPKYKTGSVGHFTGRAGHRGASGKWIGSTLKWHPSTVRQHGGVTPSELNHLNNLLRKYQLLIREHPGMSNPKYAFSSVYDLPPKDRIGGVGTDDIDAAVEAAQTELSDYDDNLTNRTDSKGNHVKPSKKERAHENVLRENLTGLQKLDTSAKGYIQDFSNIEAEIGTLGTYMDNASASPDDKSWGYDPGMGKTPKVPKQPTKKTWSQWHRIREYWEHKHTDLLSKAAKDARKHMYKHGKPNKYNLQYLQTLDSSLATSISDEKADTAALDPQGSIASVDDYIQSIGATPFLDRLQYNLSLDQGKVVEDDPGTPVREDLISQQPELQDSKEIMDFYSGVLARAQRDPKTKNNYPLLTSISEAYNAAKSDWQGLQDAQTQAATASGPSQVSLFDTARAQLYQSFGSNVAPIFGVGSGGQSGAVAAAMLAGGTGGNPTGSASAGTIDSGTTIHMTNHFTTAPRDPHSWAQGAAWELQGAI